MHLFFKPPIRSVPARNDTDPAHAQTNVYLTTARQFPALLGLSRSGLREPAHTQEPKLNL
jgi:hypothetical protein